MEEIANNKDGEVKTTTPTTSKGQSCKGCLYYSSILKSNSRNPLCIGLSRSVQVQGFFVGKSELDATREGRSLKEFKYGCLGYSVFLDEQNASADVSVQKVELPICAGVELLVAPVVKSVDHNHTHAPATLHNKDDERLTPNPLKTKPANATGNEFLTKLTRNAGLVANGVAKNMAKIGNQLKTTFDDIVYRRPKQQPTDALKLGTRQVVKKVDHSLDLSAPKVTTLNNVTQNPTTINPHILLQGLITRYQSMAFIKSSSSSAATVESSTVSKQLLLKSSSSHDATSEVADSEAILQRLRHHKRVNKIRDTIHSLLSSNGGGASPNATSATLSREDLTWLNQLDVFSSPQNFKVRCDD